MAHVSFQCRFFALKYAADAACTVLRVDQVGFSATKLSLSRSLSTPIRAGLNGCICGFHGWADHNGEASGRAEERPACRNGRGLTEERDQPTSRSAGTWPFCSPRTGRDTPLSLFSLSLSTQESRIPAVAVDPLQTVSIWFFVLHLSLLERERGRESGESTWRHVGPIMMISHVGPTGDRIRRERDMVGGSWCFPPTRGGPGRPWPTLLPCLPSTRRRGGVRGPSAPDLSASPADSAAISDAGGRRYPHRRWPRPPARRPLMWTIWNGSSAAMARPSGSSATAVWSRCGWRAAAPPAWFSPAA